MIKKVVGVLSASILSLVMVWAAIGFILIECEHTGIVSIQEYNFEDDECNTHLHDCMRYYVKKLSPTNTSTPTSLLCAPIQTILSPFYLLNRLDIVFYAIKDNYKSYLAQLQHSPPRLYLRRLTILLI